MDFFTIGVKARSSRLIYHFDGVDDYFTIPTLSLASGDVIEYSFIAPSIAPPFFEKLLVSSTDGAILESAFGVYRTVGNTVLLDGNPVVNNVTPVPLDSQVHTIKVTLNNPIDLTYVCANMSGSSPISYPMFDLKITATAGNRFYAIDDGFAVNPTIADSVGGQNGTAVNFTAPLWMAL